MRLRTGGNKRRTTTYGTSTSSKTSTRLPGGGRQVTNTNTPGSVDTVQTQQPQLDVSIGSSNSSGILIALILLDILVFWTNYFSPLIDSIWNKKPFQPKTSGFIIVGSIVFIIILSMIADSSEGGKDLVTVMTFGMWLVFIMFNGAPAMNAIETAFSTTTSNATTTPAITETPPPNQKTA